MVLLRKLHGYVHEIIRSKARLEEDLVFFYSSNAQEKLQKFLCELYRMTHICKETVYCIQKLFPLENDATKDN